MKNSEWDQEMINESPEQVVLCHSKDNVVTAKSVIRAGTLVEFAGGKKIRIREEIPFAHKIALRKIPKGGACDQIRRTDRKSGTSDPARRAGSYP